VEYGISTLVGFGINHGNMCTLFQMITHSDIPKPTVLLFIGRRWPCTFRLDSVLVRFLMLTRTHQ